MDFIIPDHDIVDKYESILIHAYYHLLNYDYRDGLFTDESSIYDMGGTGMSNEDYSKVAASYRDIADASLSYIAGQKLYFKLLNDEFDRIIFARFENTYGFKLDPRIHLLKDIALLLDTKFPGRNWETENIFIIKQLENKSAREQLLQDASKSTLTEGNVTKLPVRKKPTPDDILAGTNDYLMVTVLGMSPAEAEKLSRLNYEKRVEGRKYEPYDPLADNTDSYTV